MYGDVLLTLMYMHTWAMLSICAPYLVLASDDIIDDSRVHSAACHRAQLVQCLTQGHAVGAANKAVGGADATEAVSIEGANDGATSLKNSKGRRGGGCKEQPYLYSAISSHRFTAVWTAKVD